MEPFPQNTAKGAQATWWGETLQYMVVAALIVVPLRLFVINPYIVSGASMDPTFHTGDYLLIDQISYRTTKPLRGEVIVFRPPVDHARHFIKRIIGLPGETVTIAGGIVTITNKVGKLTLTENYVTHKTYESQSFTLGDDQYFVMGDNRAESSDSRSWGPIKRSEITGRALVRLFPLTKVDTFPGFADYTTTNPVQ